MPVSNTFQPNTQIKSAQVNENFTYITDIIDKDGSDAQIQVSGYLKQPVGLDEDGTGSIDTDNIICRGWSMIQADGTAEVTDTVTLPVTMANDDYDVFLTYFGSKNNSNITNREDTTTQFSAIKIQEKFGATKTTTQFSVHLTTVDASSIANTWRHGYSWVVVGKKG